jgi:hypothetical protein
MISLLETELEEGGHHGVPRIGELVLVAEEVVEVAVMLLSVG